jgi:hypothetical protein
MQAAPPLGSQGQDLYSSWWNDPAGDGFGYTEWPPALAW